MLLASLYDSKTLFLTMSHLFRLLVYVFLLDILVTGVELLMNRIIPLVVTMSVQKKGNKLLFHSTSA